MSVADSDIKFYYPQVRNDTGSNGGRMTANAIANGAEQAIFPNPPTAELTAGSDKYRKVCAKIENADNGPLNSAVGYLEGPSPGDDMLFYFAGTETDIQSDLTGSEALYGGGLLDATVLAGVSSIDVLVEDWANYPVFRDGDKIVIHNGYYTLVDGVYVWTAPTIFNHRTISGAPSPAGNVITLTLATPLADGFTAGQCCVMSVIDHDTVDGTVDTAVVTSAAGAFDSAEIVCNNRGGVAQVVTLTMADATAFNAVSDVKGSLGSGNRGSTFAPTNADFGIEYFQIPSSAWSGTYQAGDTVVLTFHSAEAPSWIRRIINALSSSIPLFTPRWVLEGQG